MRALLPFSSGFYFSTFSSSFQVGNGMEVRVVNLKPPSLSHGHSVTGKLHWQLASVTVPINREQSESPPLALSLRVRAEAPSLPVRLWPLPGHPSRFQVAGAGDTYRGSPRAGAVTQPGRLAG